MKETSKLNDYRLNNGYDTYFSGIGIDIGCGDDVLSKLIFKNIVDVIPYDVLLDKNFDGKYCKKFEDSQFDFIYSSHCLEHIDDPYIAFSNWIRICKSNGYIVFSVPHELFYEKCKWPSIYNDDHKTSWTCEFKSNLPKSINVHDFIYTFKEHVQLIECKTILKNFDFLRFDEDQTRESAICQIDCIVKKL